MLLQISATVTANVLTLALAYGLYQASKVYDDRDAKPGTLACIIIPCAVVSLGFWLGT